jgi:P27 family predicted phage terminase small subunit
LVKPSKSARLSDKKISKSEIRNLLEAEEKLKGGSDRVKPSSYLNAKQKSIFKQIVRELETSGIIGNLDVYILDLTAIAIDRLRSIEQAVNQDFSKLLDKTLMATKSKYTNDLFSGMKELSLSPSARVKIVNLNQEAEENAQDPLLKLLNFNKK